MALTDAEWVREQVARELDTQAEGQDMAAGFARRDHNLPLATARAERAAIYRSLADELRSLSALRQVLRHWLLEAPR
jgi:hypothetical protein